MTDWKFRNEIIDFLQTVSVNHGKEMHMTEPDDGIVRIKIGDRERTLRFHKIQDASEPDNLAETKERNGREEGIHIWEDLWLFHQEKVRSKLRSLFGFTQRIHGRETCIVKLNNEHLINFLQENHLHVAIKGKYKYGLTHADDLVAAVAFSKSRIIARKGVHFNSFELLRFCNKLNYTVVGGFTKLMNHFIKEQDPDDIMTYVDADWSDGSFYKNYGFELVEKMAPIKFMLNPHTGEREYQHILFEERTLSAAAEMEFLKEKGYKLVYNSGSYKYLLLRK